MNSPARISPVIDPDLYGAVASLEVAIGAAKSDALPSIAGELGRLSALVSLRIVGAARPVEVEDRWLEVAEVAARVGFSQSWVYEHMGEWAFRRRFGGRWRFSARGLEEWMKQRR